MYNSIGTFKEVYLLKYKYIIFDLDGTLLNTLKDLRDSVNYSLKEHGYPTRSLEEIRNFVGNGVAVLMHKAVPTGTDEEIEKDCLAVFKAHYKENMNNKTCLYDGIPELLKALREKGYKVGVVSNKFEPAVKGLCDIYFKDLIDLAAGQTETRQRKPAPDGVFYAMDELGADKEHTVYVGDSEVDVETARNSGLPCIGVTWGFRDRSVFEERNAEYIVDKPSEILSIVK